MKRILLVISAAACVIAMAEPTFAQDGMKLGLGYFRPEAPIGGRAWISDKVAVDVGFGLQNKEAAFEDSVGGIPVTRSEKKTSFCVDAGLPFVVVGDETTRFFVRPGVTYSNNPVWDSGANDWANSTEIWVAGTLGVEHWFGKRFSLAAGHGIVFKSIDPGTKNSDTSSEITSEALSLSSVGFHFYFN